MPKILIVDDNKQITSVLEEYAKSSGYATVVAHNGVEAAEKFGRENPDILLLDVMMPEKDGFAVCKEIRAVSNVPIIMITARGEDFEKIMGLEIGADDYIVKPFSSGEVMARIKAVLRRVNRAESDAVFTFDNLKINNYSVTINGAEISLTKKEVDILWLMASARNKVFSRDALLNELWGNDYYGDLRTVDTHIKRLRAKLDEHAHPAWNIKTIWGVGYKFEVCHEK